MTLWNEREKRFAGKIEDQACEIERLTRLNDALLDSGTRNAAIEECARVAEHLNGWGNKATQQSGLADHIAAVIRALKDKL